jgi:hypothetical protein
VLISPCDENPILTIYKMLQSTDIISVEIETTSQGATTTFTEEVFTTQTALGVVPPPTGTISLYTASSALNGTVSTTSTPPPVPFTGAGVSSVDIRGSFRVSVAAIIGFLAWIL